MNEDYFVSKNLYFKEQINTLYDKWCEVITHEMHKYLKPISDSHSNTNRSSKSYWTNELTCLWRKAKHRERSFLDMVVMIRR